MFSQLHVTEKLPGNLKEESFIFAPGFCGSTQGSTVRDSTAALLTVAGKQSREEGASDQT